MGIVERKRRIFTHHLLGWWKKNKRDFFWRHLSDPFQIALVELLLSRTNAENVQKFIRTKFNLINTPRKLKNIHYRKLEKILKPLGLYKQKRVTLKRMANYFLKNEGMPRNEKKLLKIPGIGGYSARVILCSFFGERVGAVDRNMVRILGRVFNIKSHKAEPIYDKKFIYSIDKLVTGDPKKFLWAMLDFAALVCTAPNPQCNKCVDKIKSLCRFYCTKVVRKEGRKRISP